MSHDVLENLAGLEDRKNPLMIIQGGIRSAFSTIGEFFLTEDQRINRQDEQLKPWLVYFQFLREFTTKSLFAPEQVIKLSETMFMATKSWNVMQKKFNDEAKRDDKDTASKVKKQILKKKKYEILKTNQMML